MSDDSDPPGNPFGGGFPFIDFSSLAGGFGSDPWATARQIAAGIANGDTSEPNVDPAVRIAFEQLARVAELQVVQATGLALGEGRPPTIRPATRQEWAQTTLDQWRAVLEAMGESLQAGIAGAPDLSAEELEELPGLPGMPGLGPDFLAQIMSMLGPAMLSMTVGSMVGQLSRSSIGAYDLPIPRTADDELLVVAANLAEFTEEWSVPSDDARLWVCLHVYLHHAVLRLPQVRERLLELIRNYVSAFEPGSGDLAEQFGGLDPTDPTSAEAFAGLLEDPERLMGVMQSDRQRAMLPEISALLAAIVGWVDHMMDRIGGSYVGSYPMLTEALRRRRVTTSPSDRFLERMLGLELDQACYEQGRRFVDGVVERAGEDALAQLWSEATNLPTPNEIDAPGLWLARIGIDFEFDTDASSDDDVSDDSVEEE